VTPSLKDPFPGWVDNYSALNGIFDGVVRGTLRALQSRKAVVSDLAPVDLVANTLLAAAADVGNTRLRYSN